MSIIKTVHIYKRKPGNLGVYYKDSENETHKIDLETGTFLQFPGEEMDLTDRNEIRFMRDESLSDEKNGVYVRKCALLWRDYNHEDAWFVEFGLGDLNPVKGYMAKATILVILIAFMILQSLVTISNEVLGMY